MKEPQEMSARLWIERYGGDCMEADTVDGDDLVLEGYGLQVQALTPAQIEALQNGQYLLIDILGEYSALLYLKPCPDETTR